MANKGSIIIDKNHDIPVYSPICSYCGNRKQTFDGRFCKAFPEGKGIPMDIWTGKNDHKSTHPQQQNKIVFELKSR